MGGTVKPIDTVVSAQLNVRPDVASMVRIRRRGYDPSSRIRNGNGQ